MGVLVLLSLRWFGHVLRGACIMINTTSRPYIVVSRSRFIVCGEVRHDDACMRACTLSCCCLLTQQVNGCVMDELAALRQAERQANEIVHKAREGEQMHSLSRARFVLKQRHLA